MSSMSRFPIECLPLMKLMRALFTLGPQQSECSVELLNILGRSAEFTEVLNEEFRDYDQADEELTPGHYQIFLTGDLPLFLSYSRSNDRDATGSELIPFGASD